MSAGFDPLYKWLGIPPDEQPPHHYRLLGIGIAFIFVFLTLVFIWSNLSIREGANRIKASEAWSRFSRLFTANIGHFIGYALFVLVLVIPVVIVVVLFGCMTCCCGFLILAIPYISDVILLPLTYTYRAFGLEFLEQFGPEYRLFPVPENPPPARDVPPSFNDLIPR